jgi:glycosyltransferase involved in cell wall biosynthesis
MASFGFGPYHIQEWSDPDYWRPHADVREPGLVGYMNEGPHTAATVERVKTLAQAAGATVRFIEISGNEQQVLDAMQRCDLFLGMNPGKHPLWGEGCPRSPQEAMHVGAVPVVFDVLGNHEYLIDDFTGRMVSNGDVTAMAEAVVDLMRNPEHKERLRQQGVSLMQTCWVGAHRWSMVKEFLDL